MHTYWSKKPHDAIREYIKHYTKPGDLVLDPFCGSGGTVLSALMEGRKAIAIDRSPAATFITKNYCTPVSVIELKKSFEDLKKRIKQELDWLYETRCDRCGGKATIAHTVYSQVFQCQRCLENIPLYDCIEIQGKTAKGKPKKINICPICHKKDIIEEISTRSKKLGSIPVLVSYFCLGKCNPKRAERKHNDEDQKKRNFFKEYDLGKIKEIQKKDIPHSWPKHRMMNVKSDIDPWGDEWRPGRNFRTVAELFTKRNLWALSCILAGINDIPKPYNDVLKFTVSSFLLNLSRLYKHRSTGGGQPTGYYYIPQINRENEAWTAFERKFRDILKAHSELSYAIKCNKIYVSTESSININKLPDNSIDFVFTDPPYAGKFQYGELNFIWEAWLNLDTNWHSEEITINNTRGVSEEDWAKMMRSSLSECYRILKPGRWLSLCYHDTSEGTWSLVQDLMNEIGFIVDTNTDALYIDTGQKTYNQTQAKKVTQRDLIINFCKPKNCQENLIISNNKHPSSINTQVKTNIIEVLANNPGLKKDRIYDVVVSRLVRTGEMEPHDFEYVLRQIADEVKTPVMKDLIREEEPNLFGTHEQSLWYLKENIEGAEEAEKATAVDAAKKIEGFIKKECKKELERTELKYNQLKKDCLDIEEELNNHAYSDDRAAKSRLRRELVKTKEQLEKLSKQRDEWSQNALHYTYITEFYFPITPKPRCTLIELLEDYFFQTDEGNWRPPLTAEEREEKQKRRNQAVRRKLKQYCRALESGEAIPEKNRPDDRTLMEWIRSCKKSEAYYQGKLLYEKGGLILDNLTEEEQVNVEEDYQVCVRMLARSTK
jgi:16S rRNA G966 N2-methylase RsmD